MIGRRDRLCRGAVLLAAFVAALAALGGCKTNTATGRLQFNTLSAEREIALGREAAPELIAGYGGEVPDGQLRAYVAEVGDRVAAEVEAEYRDLPWTFTFLNSEVINAFALPGGQVFISRGLVERMTDEAQLAGVLAHEVGHVTAEHADQQIGRQILLSLGVAAAGVAAGQSDREWAQVAAQIAVTGAGVYALSFNRNEELEADALGMRYMSRAGYDPAAQRDVMTILRDAGGAGQPEIFSTHPHPESRIRAIDELLGGEYAATGGDRFEDRFRRSMLSRLASLPPALDERTALALAGVDPQRVLGGCGCASCGR